MDLNNNCYSERTYEKGNVNVVVFCNNFIKKETLAQVFSCKFCEITEDIFFTEHLWASA